MEGETVTNIVVGAFVPPIGVGDGVAGIRDGDGVINREGERVGMAVGEMDGESEG